MSTCDSPQAGRAAAFLLMPVESIDNFLTSAKKAGFAADEPGRFDQAVDAQFIMLSG
jgi:hypothetical protein